MAMKPDKAHTLRRVIHGFTRVVYLIFGGGSLLGLTFFIVADVGLRGLFNSPIPGSYEVVMFMMITLVFSALSYTATMDGHVIVELVVSRVPKRVQRFLNGVSNLLTAGLFALIAQQNIVRAKALRLEGLTSSILHVPVYPFYLFTAFGCALLSLVLLLNVFDSLMSGGKE
jgi:TRAP-type C4-dicarboxylate transport system permease small subunit